MHSVKLESPHQRSALRGCSLPILNGFDFETIDARYLMITFSTCHLKLGLYSVELHKANIESRSQGGAGEATNQSAVAAAAASSALANALPLAQLLAKPGAKSALGLSGLTALTSLSEILTGAAAQQLASAVQTTGVHEPKVRTKKSFLFFFVFFVLYVFTSVMDHQLQPTP